MTLNRYHAIGIILLLVLICCALWGDHTSWTALIGIGVALVATLLMLLLASDGSQQTREILRKNRRF